MGRLISLGSAVRIRRRLARSRESFMFTNGGLDLLHVAAITLGHASSILAARIRGSATPGDAK